ncbi:MAG: hypothetical protein KAV68_00325 [Dehalococcoidales bacterium]|nr:hypothetical protein [Dehalococcoidales bacterium]
MKNLLSAVKEALEQGNWYAALFMALALPDICGNIQYPQLKSEQRYVQWFNKYPGCKYIHEVGADGQKHVFLSGEDCYALRCSLLHEGSDVISHQRCRKVLDSFLFLTKGSHCNYCDVNGRTFLQLNVGEFYKDICNAVENWLDDIASDNSIQKELSNMITIHTSGVTKDGIHFG